MMNVKTMQSLLIVLLAKSWNPPTLSNSAVRVKGHLPNSVVGVRVHQPPFETYSNWEIH